MSRPSPFTFYELFCGGGMARTGLGPNWSCLFANDLDPDKARAYRANFGDGDLKVGDVWDLTTADLPGRADRSPHPGGRPGRQRDRAVLVAEDPPRFHLADPA